MVTANALWEWREKASSEHLPESFNCRIAINLNCLTLIRLKVELS